MGPYSGKRTGETSLFRQLFGQLIAGDVLLADAMFSNYWTIALLLARGVDMVSHGDGRRLIGFRKGRRLGRYDHIVPWYKPKRPSWMNQRLYCSLPETLPLRELKVQVRQKGFRCRHLHLVPTLLDAQLYRKEDLAMATHRINDRPDRIEPRGVRRRPKKLIDLNEPRSIAKARLLNGA